MSPWTRLWPNLKAAVAKSLLMDGSTLGSNWKFERVTRGQLLISPLGAKFDRRGELCHPGVKLSLGLKLSLKCEVIPQVWSYPPGVKLSPRGEVIPPGAKLFPGGEVIPQGRSYSPGVKLSPRDEVIPQGWRPSVCPFVLLKIIVCSPLGVNKGVNIPPRGQSSCSNIVKNWPPKNWQNIGLFEREHKFWLKDGQNCPKWWSWHCLQKLC
jgi:hypothetical protein